MSTAREIIEVMANEADRADGGAGWSYLVLQRMAVCAQRLLRSERDPADSASMGERLRAAVSSTADLKTSAIQGEAE